MKINNKFIIKLQNNKTSKDIYEILKAQKNINDRCIFKMKIKQADIVIDFDAKDPISFRASINSFLTMLNHIYEVDNLED